MTEAEFWKLIESAGTPTDCTPEEQCEAIEEGLASATKQELIEFESVRQQLLVRAYTWPMIKACFITLSYVSDDVFEDFCHWIILHGKERFEKTVASPDALADFAVVEDPTEEISGEPLMFVVENVWDGDIEEIEEEVHSPEIPDISSEWPPKEELAKEFPKLFDRFWDDDRIREIHGG